jgi:predicted  nucleic acid-binding Zn-ribbon protein
MDGKELSQVELLVEIVGEMINAQVAAHERYSQAFIRILDALETIIDSQDNISGGDTAYFKQLASDISEFNEKIKDQEAEDKVWRTNFFNKLDNHISNHDSKITDLQELIESFNDRSEVTNEALQTKLNEIVEKINDIEEINISSHTLLEDQINQILESKKHWKKTFEKILIYFGAIASLIGIIMALMQLNILDITWKLK